ncbi:MAG: hypothetical protein ACRD1T_24425, partial [Acidimicrobiia bacterium]
MFLPLLFPTGRLMSRRWRPVLWGGFLALALAILSNAFAVTEPIPGIQNPYAMPRLSPLWKILQDITVPVLIFSLVGAIASLVVRFRRSRDVERQQMKWFIFAGALAPAPFVAYEINETVSEFLLPLIAILFPIAVGIAILRYRLYDIDVVINKTLVFGALAAFITLIYVGVVVGIGALIGSGDEPNLGLSLAATALVAVAFQPLRERIQRLANRVVYGQRLSPYEAVTNFSHRMAESISFEQILPSIGQAAAGAVGGERAKVKLLFPQGGSEETFWPDQSQTQDTFDATVEVAHKGELVGEISVAKKKAEALSPQEHKLLRDLASQAGLAFSNLRLTEELRAK